MPPHLADALKNSDQLPPYAHPMNENASHVEFLDNFQVLSKIWMPMFRESNRQWYYLKKNGNLAAARIQDFMRMNLPEFHRSKVDKILNSLLMRWERLLRSFMLLKRTMYIWHPIGLWMLLMIGLLCERIVGEKMQLLWVGRYCRMLFWIGSFHVRWGSLK